MRVKNGKHGQAWEIVDNTGHVEFDGFYRTRTYRCGCGDIDNDSRRDLMAVYDFFWQIHISLFSIT